jgi:microcystin degradation protein MlrC
LRIAIAEIGQETDTFSTLDTDLELFKSHGLFVGDEIPEMIKSEGMFGAFLDVAKQQTESHELFPIIRAWAGAGGWITDETLEYFEKALVEGLKKALPLDGFFFAQHGAAAAHKDDDMEGYLLEVVRKVIGPNVPIVSPLDHHANITERMVKHTDLIVGHLTQPHDPYNTGHIAAELSFPIFKGDYKPTVGFTKIPMITQQDQFLTASGPMKEWFDVARNLEEEKGVLTVSPFPMQPWLDVREGGWAVLAYTDDDPARAQKMSDGLADQAWSMRARFWESSRSAPEDAVALAEDAAEGLVILSDTGDSVYGGAPGDSTCILKALIARNVSQIAYVPMLDPAAQAAAAKAGIGADITLSVGGKIDHIFSTPVEVTGKVAAICKGLEARVEKRGFSDIGPTALIEIGNIRLVLQSRRSFAVNQPILYTHLGLDIKDAKMVVVKTASNFQFFAPWAQQMIRVDSPGTTQSDLKAFTWKSLPRPIHPLDDLSEWQAPNRNK